MQSKTSIHVSVVVPVYGASRSIRELYERLVATLLSIGGPFEIILVNDASPDNSWETIRSLARADSRVRGINLSRNFGQHPAIAAGLAYTRGDWVVVMDCDLQDQPEEIAKLYARALQGVDIVVGKRVNRQDRLVRLYASKLFYSVLGYFTSQRIDSTTASFGIYSKRAIDSIKTLREQNFAFGLLALWVGFEREEIEVAHSARKHGRSGYTWSKMMGLAFDCIVAHSNKPLKLSVGLGLLLSFASMLFSIWLVLRYIIWARPPQGWTSLMVSLYFLSGLIVGSIGMVGLYVGKVFDQVKGRPLYIVASTTFD